MKEAQERKRVKYANLVAKCWKNRWKACCEPIEMGSLDRLLGLLGIFRLHRQRAIKNILETAEKPSRWVWFRRREAWHSTTWIQLRVCSPPAASPG